MTDQQKKQVAKVIARRSFAFWKWPELILAQDVQLRVEGQEQAALRESYRDLLTRNHAMNELIAEMQRSVRTTNEELNASTEREASLVEKLSASEIKSERLTTKLSEEETELLHSTLEASTLKAQLAKSEADVERAKLQLKQEHNAHIESKSRLLKLIEWIHATHRLSSPPQGIRALLSKAMKLMPLLVFLPTLLLAQPPPPVLRNQFTTNTAGVPVRGVNDISITNAASGTNWLFHSVRPQTVARLIDVTNIASAFSGGDAGGTNARQFGTLSLTNLSGNPNVVTNILGAGSVTVTSNNLGTFTISSTGGSTPTGLPFYVTMWGPSGPGLLTNSGFFQLATNRMALGPTNTFLFNDPDAQNVGMGDMVMLVPAASSFNTVVGYQSFTNPSGTANGNTFVGASVAPAIIDGDVNVGIGWFALNAITSGANNVAIGRSAMLSMISGVDNVGVGSTALDSATGNENTAIGSGSGSLNSAGIRNTYLGAFADGVQKTNSTAIGYLSTLTLAGQMVFGSGVSNYQFRGVNYVFPSANGSAGTVLTNDGSGILGWGATGGGDAGGTNARQFGSLSLTNLSGNPNVATNILGAGTVTVTSNNLGEWTITGSGGAGGDFNVNQFFATTVTNIKSGAVVSNLVVYPSNNTSVSLVVTNTPGSTMNLADILNTNSAGLSIRSNGVAVVHTDVTLAGTLPALLVHNSGSANTTLILSNSFGGNGSVLFYTDSAGNAFFSPENAGGQTFFGGVDSGSGIIHFNLAGVGSLWSLLPSAQVSTWHGSDLRRGQITNVWDVFVRSNITFTEVGGGADGVSIKSPTGASTYSLTLPTTNGLAGQSLYNANGAGALAWISVDAGGTNARQFGSEVLSNLVNTVGNNVTNVISLSTTNATSKPLTNSYTAGVLTLFGLEQGANITLTPNGSNIVVASTSSGGGSTIQTNTVFVSSTAATNLNFISGTYLSFKATNASGDVSIQHDLTDANLTNWAKIDTNTFASVGVYRTIYFDAGAMVPNETLGAQFDTAQSATPTNRMLDSYIFTEAVSNIVQFKIALPMEWDVDTVKWKFFYYSTNAGATVTNVWEINSRAITNDDPLNDDWGTAVTVTNKITAANDLLRTVSTPAMTIGGTPQAEDLIWFRIRRLPAHASDNDNGEIKLLGAWLQYKESTTEPASW